MKTYKVLPNVNDFKLGARVASDVNYSKSGNVATFDVVRNFGGDKEPVFRKVTMFKPKDGFPEGLKKGAPVKLSAYFTPDNWVDKDGKQHHDVAIVVKKLEVVTLTEGQPQPDDNNIDFAGRLAGDPYVSGNSAVFTAIRNFGGDKGTVSLRFSVFKKDEESFPECLKKGAAVTVHAYITPNSYTGKDGEKKDEVRMVVKKVEPAELVERKVSDDKTQEEAEAEASEQAIVPEA